MTKAVPASPTLAYLIPGGAFASGQGYYVDRSPRGLLRQLVHRGALCRTGVSWLQPPHPTPNPEAAVRPARGPCGQAMLSRWPPERQAERKTFNPSTTSSPKSRRPASRSSRVASSPRPSRGASPSDKGPASGLHDLAGVFKPVSDGGRLPRSGLVDIAASQEPDGREVFNNIRYGVFVTFKANNEYTRDCFKQYGLLVDKSGWYGSMWRPFHLIGLETSVSVLSAVLRHEPTGTPTEFRGDAVATAKRDLKPGEMLDGEGGYAVWANAIPATKSLAARALPIGLAHNVRLKRPVAKDVVVSVDDVELDRDLDVVELRREMEREAAPVAVKAA